MVSPKRAICHAAVTVAEAYGPNVSRGILAMEARIVELEKERERLAFIESHLGKRKRMRERRV